MMNVSSAPNGWLLIGPRGHDSAYSTGTLFLPVPRWNTETFPCVFKAALRLSRRTKRDHSKN